MKIIESLENRRSYYAINADLPVARQEVEALVKKATVLVPDAFNMKSARVVLVFDEAHQKLWDSIYDAYEGKVPREKIDSFKAGVGTILYFYDESVVEGLQEQFATYAANFPIWAQQANGMLQISIWSGLRELEIGASLQHYNPVIDESVKAQFGLDKKWKLIAQMPFGGIADAALPKAEEDENDRVIIVG